jgi:DNA polymerase III subunit gamma/tau
LSAANNQSVDLLTATWKVSGTTVGVTKIAAVGAVYASVSAIRAREPRVADVSAYPTAAVTELVDLALAAGAPDNVTAVIADVIEVDAASHNGVDDVRALRDRVAFAAMRSRYKVYILDEAHMLSKGAWNALLKTLEEPPPGVVFVLATTELHKVPDTIRSRCQVLHFRRIGDSDIKARLRMIVDSEGVAIDEAVLDEIAAVSKGGMRDAETALERALQRSVAIACNRARQPRMPIVGERIRERFAKWSMDARLSALAAALAQRAALRD